MTIINKVKKHIIKISEMNSIEKICFGILVAQILFIAYTNFFLIPNTLDNDAAKIFLHAIEIWKNKKIFLPNWSNMTTLEIDCSSLLAIPIYGLTGNIYFSFGLSNLIFVLVFIYVFSILLDRVSVSGPAKILTFIFLLIPFSFGQLLYYNMMFFAGCHYVIKVLVPLLYIVVLTSEKVKLREIIIGGISVILTLIMGISSGPYVLITGIVPIGLAYFICEGIYKKHIKDFMCIKVLYIAFIGFSAVLGEFICLKKQVNTSGNAISLISGGELTQSFFAKIKAYIELMGGCAYESVPILSVDGMIKSFKCVFAIVLLIILIAAMVNEIRNPKQSNVSKYICASVFINFIVVLLTDSFGTARYQLVFIIPSFIIMSLFIDRTIQNISVSTIKNYAVFLAVFLMFAELIVSDYQVLTNQSFPYFAHENSKYQQIVDFVETQPEEHVFVINDNGQPEVYRIMDLHGDKDYLVYMTDSQTIEVHDYYWSDEYYDWLNGSFLLVGCDSNTSIDMMPEDIVSRSEKIGQVQNYSIYRVN